MTLPWVRLETALPRNPKILDLVNGGNYRAAWVYVCSIAYCGEHVTDGRIPRAALPFIHARPADARALVAARLWVETDNGYALPDWAEYQIAAATLEEVSRTRRRASRVGNCHRWHEQPFTRPECVV